MDGYWTVAVSGATGLVGNALCELLHEHGHTVRRIVRKRPAEGSTDIYWRPSEGEIDAAALAGVDAVVHLAGDNIAEGRWSDAKKKSIVDSRVQGTTLLAQTLAQLDPMPKVLVSASAIGFYGERGQHPVDESSPPGKGFLPETCVDWEAATQSAWEAGIRVVQARIGVVLARDGGAIKAALPLFKLGLGGVVGGGRQMMSWIALDDLIRALEFCVFNDSMHGAVNATAPQPVNNREFTKALGRALGRPTVIPAPALAVRAALGEFADETILCSASVLPTRLSEAGFDFHFPQVDQAIRHELEEPG